MIAPVSTEHFIPFRKADVLRLILEDDRLGISRVTQFGELATILQAVFHFELHRELEVLKDAYSPMDPNRDTRPLPVAPAVDRVAQERKMLEALERVLTRANYKRLPPEELNRALAEESVFHVKLHVDMDDFAELILFARGSRTVNETESRWFGLKKETKPIDLYERVVIYARFKDAEHFPARRRRKLAFAPGSAILKLFQNIPKGDLEMLLPNTEVRMKAADHLLIGVPAVAGAIAVVVTKLGATLLILIAVVAALLGLRKDDVTVHPDHLAALSLGLGALGVHFFRQFGRFKNRKILFMKALADSLYYKNLDNNAGVFHRVIDDAEEEECKEALLAYFGLLVAEKPLSREELDQEVERWLQARTGLALDFEVDDALAKLERLGLATRRGERFTVQPLPSAKATLDRLWDNYFQYG
jgi:hypothetical protein